MLYEASSLCSKIHKSIKDPLFYLLLFNAIPKVSYDNQGETWGKAREAGQLRRRSTKTNS